MQTGENGRFNLRKGINEMLSPEEEVKEKEEELSQDKGVKNGK